MANLMNFIYVFNFQYIWDANYYSKKKPFGPFLCIIYTYTIFVLLLCVFWICWCWSRIWKSGNKWEFFFFPQNGEKIKRSFRAIQNSPAWSYIKGDYGLCKCKDGQLNLFLSLFASCICCIYICITKVNLNLWRDVCFEYSSMKLSSSSKWTWIKYLTGF